MRRPRYPHPPFGLNMTPLIDVVFQLLVFFVCIVEFRRAEEVLGADLPIPELAVGLKQPEELDLGRIDVHVSLKEVKLRFQGKAHSFADPNQAATLEKLSEQLRQWSRLAPTVPVRLSGASDAPTGILVRVYDACLQAGVTKVQLGPPEETP